jgi:hypothetical protein
MGTPQKHRQEKNFMVDSNDTAANTKLAAAHLKEIASAVLGEGTDVKIERGVSVNNFKPGASEETIDFVFKNDVFKDPVKANELGQKLLNELHKSEDLREHAVFLSPHDQLAFNKKEVGELQDAAKAAGIPFPPGVDFTQAAILHPEYSRSQLPKHATQVIDGPDVTSIRINVPTDPTNLEGAETLAQKVEADLNKRLPDIKKGMIERIEKKSYAKLTPEIKKHLEAHEFTVSTQQQGNWTSVFINIRSPEQVLVRDHPEEKAKFENAVLEKTNMLQQVENADQRAKLAARAAMFEGEKLGTPSNYFMQVAGTEDIKIGLGKMLEYLKKAKPEYTRRADALMKESFLISNDDWNLPPEKQPLRKPPVSLGVKAGTDELKLGIRVQVGKGDPLLQALATNDVTKAENIAPPAMDKIVSDAVAAAGAGAVATCPPGEIAVAGAGAVAASDGTTVAGAGAACIEAPKPEMTAANSACKEVPVVEKKDGIVLPNGSKISNKAISSFLKEVRSHADRAEGSKAGSLGLGA